MRVLIVGSGAREHALADAVSRGGASVVVAPGNAGIATRFEVSADEARAIEADLVVIGPEAPLVAGLADDLRAAGRLVVGPGAAGAALEGSKIAMKRLCDAAGVPTARWGVATTIEEAAALFDRFGPPYVIKTDGLAAGKGVLVTADRLAAEADVRAKLSGEAFGDAGRRLVIEEGLGGRELSMIWLVNERDARLLPVAQDHKRLLDGDLGPNTGGMGAYAPAPWANDSLIEEATDRVLEPLLAELRRVGIVYRGFLYAGLMATEDGLSLLEINVRLGDPEAQAIAPLLGEGFVDALVAAARGGTIGDLDVQAGAALGIVMAARGYPEASIGGDRIEGIAEAERLGARVYTAGVRAEADGALATTGGRILTVVGRGDDLATAREVAYRARQAIRIEGATWRSDLGLGAE